MPPRYDAAGLAGVLPGVAASLGVAALADADAVPMRPARRAVVVLVDGLGYELIRRRGGHAPFLRSLLPAAYRISAGFPSTTATSMGTFGTGLPPGSHGLLGYEVLVPGEDRLLNELSWEDGPDPLAWQPQRTVFELAEADGVAVTSIGPGFFDGSGLTRAALRGGRFRAADTLPARVDAALAGAAVRPALARLPLLGRPRQGRPRPRLPVLGVGRRARGASTPSSRGWCAPCPSDTAVYITADHGMVDAPHALRIDLAHDAELAAGVRHVGGEPRALQLYCEDGAADDVAADLAGRGSASGPGSARGTRP